MTIDKESISFILKNFYLKKYGIEVAVEFHSSQIKDMCYGSPLTLIGVTRPVQVARATQYHTSCITDNVLKEAINFNFESEGVEVASIQRDTTVNSEYTGFDTSTHIENAVIFNGIKVEFQERSISSGR